MLSYCQSLQNLKSGFDQYEVVSREAVVGRTVLDGEKDDKKKGLCLLRNCIFVDIFYGFLEYRALSGNDDIVEGRIMHLARLDNEVATVLTCS